MPTSSLKVAIIHDWLVTDRGGERVLRALCDLYPQAEIFTLFHTPGVVSPRIEKHRIHVSWLNGIPGVHRFYRYLLPLFPMAIERFRLAGFDLVISSSHCVAKGVIPPPNTPHLCYCHTPARYAWDRYDDYFSHSLAEPLIYPFIHYLRAWDVTSSARVDAFVANSKYTAGRIEKYYRRTSEVIYPFVELDRLGPVDNPSLDYYLVVSAFAPYKRIDLAIEACNQLGKKLLIVGDGQDSHHLKHIAGPTIEFVGKKSNREISRLYANAKALLFPGEEDFGITPLESMACGRPIIAFGRGGATETVIDEKTGLFFREQTVDSLSDAIEKFETMEFSPQACRKQAEAFSEARFKQAVQTSVNALLKEKQPAAVAPIPHPIHESEIVPPPA